MRGRDARCSDGYQGGSMHAKRLVVAMAGALVVLGCGVALADTMHPELGAKLSGMGERGIVNLQSDAAKGRLCWTFDLSSKGITGASVRDAHGMVVARLGSAYKAKSCAVATM